MAVNIANLPSTIATFDNDLYLDVKLLLKGDFNDITLATKELPTGRYVGSDDILHRFHLGNEWGSHSSNTVFSAGYEDPAYLTFKLEFGGWGYSLLDINNIASQQESDKFTNAYLADYDLFPMGLLDTNYIDFSKNNINWSDLQQYNSYNYLMNRNEDSRAAYILTFTKGLFAIQKDMPYIFQKISGLDKLQEFNSKRGSRLQDVKLSIECLEGTDLKIRTLLEAYRKAAYDDIWQRWILPDIYRYFKLIIYIFDRRILLTGKKTYSIEQDNFPIFAFECSPCEIDIESHMDTDQTVVYGNNFVTTKFNITVKNVKTYYSNALFNKLNSTVSTNWFSDLESFSEKQDIKSTDISNNTNFRMRWMRKMFMTPSEYYSFYEKKNIHQIGDSSDRKLLGLSAWQKTFHIPDNTWHYAIVSDSIFDIHSWKSFTKYMKNLVTTHRKLIRDSRTVDKDVVVNDLIKPDYKSYQYNQSFYPIYLDMNKALLLIAESIKYMIKHMIDNIHLIGNEPFYKLLDPGMELNTDKVFQEFILPIINELNTDNQELIKPILDLNKIPEQELVKPNIVPYNSDMELVSYDINEYNSSMTMTSPIISEYDSSIDMIKPLDSSYNSSMNMVKPEFNLTKSKLKLTKPILNLNKPEHELISPEFNEYNSEMDLIKIQDSSYNSSMNMVDPIINEYNSEMDMTKVINHTYNSSMNMIDPVINEYNSEMDLIKIQDSSYNSSMNMINHIINEYNPELQYVQIILNLEKSNQELISPIINIDKAKHNYTELIINDEHQGDMNLVKPELTEYHQGDMNLVNIIDSSYNSSMNMVEPIITEYHQGDMNLVKPVITDELQGDMNLVKHELTEYHQGDMNMIKPVITDEHQGDMNLVNIIDSNYSSSMNMVTPEHIEYLNNMNMVKPVITDEHQGDMEMVKLNEIELIQNKNLIPLPLNEFKATFDMMPVIPNEYSVEMDMTKLPLDISALSDMDMSKPDISEYSVEMDMTKLPLNISIIDNMDMITVNTDTSVLSNMDMIKPNINNTYNPDMDMITVNTDISVLSDINMVKPEISDYDVNIDMVKLELNNISIPVNNMVSVLDSSYDINMLMQPVNTDIEYTSNMLMTELSLNEYKSSMSLYKPNDYNYDVSMSYVRNNDISVNLGMPNVSVILNEYNKTLDTTNNILTGNDYKVKMGMIPLSLNVALSEKVLMLTSLSDADISKAPIELLLSLSDIIDKTVKQIKALLDNMELTENKPDIPLHKHLEMVSIKQPPRRLFIADHLINEIDETAVIRALNALTANDKDNKNSGYTSLNRKGTAF